MSQLGIHDKYKSLFKALSAPWGANKNKTREKFTVQLIPLILFNFSALHNIK